MASGKSTIGKEISKNLDMNFIDLDAFISKQEKRSIPEIFKIKGEIYFRRVESVYLKELLDNEGDFVLSLGGGTPCYSNNMELIQYSKATSFYIKASIPTLAARLVEEKNTRPLIADLENEQITEFVAKHLFERKFFYEEASVILNTENKSIQEIVLEINTVLD
jgi:shikimate kinase